MKTIRLAGRCTLLSLIMFSVLAIWTACGDEDATAPGGGGGGTPSPSFVDCWVWGLEFSASSTPPVKGFTGHGGRFDCPLGETVTFKVGDIVIGSGVCGPCMNPIEITGATDIFEFEPTNIARFLQTLDDDDNPSNGILVIEAVHTAAAGRSLDFGLHPDAFAADTVVQQTVSDLTAVTAAGTRTLVESATARAHLRNTLLRAFHADYVGTFDGYRDQDEWEGDWELDIDDSGNIVGMFMPDGGDHLSISGNLQPSGSFACDDGGITGLWFAGRIVRDDDGLHSVEGSWNDYEQGSGRFVGSRVTAYPTVLDCD